MVVVRDDDDPDCYFGLGFGDTDDGDEIDLTSTPDKTDAKVSCCGMWSLLNTKIYIDNELEYRVSQAERITCTKSSPSSLELEISFGRAYLKAIVDIVGGIEVPATSTTSHLWATLDISPSQNPDKAKHMSDLFEEDYGEYPSTGLSIHFDSIRFED